MPTYQEGGPCGRCVLLNKTSLNVVDVVVVEAEFLTVNSQSSNVYTEAEPLTGSQSSNVVVEAEFLTVNSQSSDVDVEAEPLTGSQSSNAYIEAEPLTGSQSSKKESLSVIGSIEKVVEPSSFKPSYAAVVVTQSTSKRTHLYRALIEALLDWRVIGQEVYSQIEQEPEEFCYSCEKELHLTVEKIKVLSQTRQVLARDSAKIRALIKILNPKDLLSEADKKAFNSGIAVARQLIMYEYMEILSKRVNPPADIEFFSLVKQTKEKSFKPTTENVRLLEVGYRFILGKPDIPSRYTDELLKLIESLKESLSNQEQSDLSEEEYINSISSTDYYRSLPETMPENEWRENSEFESYSEWKARKMAQLKHYRLTRRRSRPDNLQVRSRNGAAFQFPINLRKPDTDISVSLDNEGNKNLPSKIDVTTSDSCSETDITDITVKQKSKPLPSQRMRTKKRFGKKVPSLEKRVWTRKIHKLLSNDQDSITKLMMRDQKKFVSLMEQVRQNNVSKTNWDPDNISETKSVAQLQREFKLLLQVSRLTAYTNSKSGNKVCSHGIAHKADTLVENVYFEAEKLLTKLPKVLLNPFCSAIEKVVALVENLRNGTNFKYRPCQYSDVCHWIILSEKEITRTEPLKRFDLLSIQETIDLYTDSPGDMLDKLAERIYLRAADFLGELNPKQNFSLTREITDLSDNVRKTFEGSEEESDTLVPEQASPETCVLENVPESEISSEITLSSLSSISLPDEIQFITQELTVPADNATLIEVVATENN